jgi:predicted kinase
MSVENSAILIIFGGLPGTGKTTLARALAEQLGAVFLRIDTVEQTLRQSQTFAGSMDDTGYRVAYAVASDNLRLGRTVVADSVNPLQITRNAWRASAAAVGARAVEVEVVCSNAAEHRRRVEFRLTDIPGLSLPSWQEVCDREYDPWDRSHIVVDTSDRSVEQALTALRSMLSTEK